MLNKVSQSFGDSNTYFNLFSTEQVSTHFNRLKNGNFETLDIGNYVDEIAIGSTTVQCRQSHSTQRTTTCELHLSMVVYNERGQLIQTIEKSAKGFGFSENEAKRAALENLNL